MSFRWLVRYEILKEINCTWLVASDVCFPFKQNFNFKWIEPHCAAQCLLLHVKRIEIFRFGGQKDEMELVKYLLKNGEGLNRMMIVFMNSATKKKLCQKLLRFERGSTTCEVQFLWDLCQEILCFLKLILGHICILFSPWSLY